jgi:hypothetical protein
MVQSDVKSAIELYIAQLKEGATILSYSSIADTVNGRIKVIASVQD